MGNVYTFIIQENKDGFIKHYGSSRLNGSVEIVSKDRPTLYLNFSTLDEFEKIRNFLFKLFKTDDPFDIEKYDLSEFLDNIHYTGNICDDIVKRTIKSIEVTIENNNCYLVKFLVD